MSHFVKNILTNSYIFVKGILTIWDISVNICLPKHLKMLRPPCQIPFDKHLKMLRPLVKELLTADATLKIPNF